MARFDNGGGGGGGGTQAPSSSLTRPIAQTAHGFNVGQAVYFNGTEYALAKADAATDADVDGLVAAVIDANNFTIQTAGYMPNLGGLGLVAGTDYYLSPTVAGGLTATPPSQPGEVSKPLLHTDSTSSGYLENMRGLVLPAAAVTYIAVQLVAENAGVAVGEDLGHYTITSDLNGLSLTSVVATCSVAPTGTPLSFGVRKNASTELLSPNVTVDVGKTSSELSATPPGIIGANAGVATGDVLFIDCDQADSNGASRASIIRLGFS